MKVILTKDVDALGFEGTIIEVKDGYARNFLLPKNFAVVASVGNLKTWENEKKTRERRIAKDIENANKQRAELEGKSFEISAKCGEEGKLYGAVTAQDIADAVTAKTKIDIDRKKLVLAEPIKTAGEHKVMLKIYKDVKAELTVVVIPEA